MASVSRLTPDEALAQIKNFANQTRGFMDPLGIQSIFQRTVYQDVQLLGGSVKKRFLINAEPGKQPNTTTQAVQEALREALKAVQGKPMSPMDALSVNQVTNQLHIFEQMEKAKTASISPAPLKEGTRAQPSAPIAPPRTILQLKDELRAKKISTIKFPGAVGFGIGLFVTEGIVAGLATAAAVAIIVSGAATAGIGFAVVAGLGFLIGLGGLGFAIGALIYRGRNKGKLDKATSFEQIFPLFENLTLEARIQFLVKLGPEFRAGLLEWGRKTNGISHFTQSLCEFINNVTSPEVPEDLKKQYYKDMGPNLASREEGWSYPIAIFDSVREVLESEGYVRKEWLPTS